MGIEALWAVDFATPTGTAGSGVVVFETQRIFGGDSMYYYLGDYQLNGAIASGTVTITHYAGQPWNVFGIGVQQVQLQFQGQLQDDKIVAIGVDPTNSQRQLTMRFRRLAGLP